MADSSSLRILTEVTPALGVTMIQISAWIVLELFGVQTLLDDVQKSDIFMEALNCKDKQKKVSQNETPSQNNE